MQNDNPQTSVSEQKENQEQQTETIFVDPEKIIKMAGMKEGDIVADFGCGPGYFSLPVAIAIGQKGQVYAFDVLTSALEALESRAKMEGVDNITAKRINLEKEKSTGLADESVDWVIIKNVLFQNKDKHSILKEAKRVMKNGASIMIMEWNNNLAIGPEKESRIDSQELVDIILTEGFVFRKKADAGNYHYIMVASKL